jgi:uncharacterized iron-regulated membrane protein
MERQTTIIDLRGSGSASGGAGFGVLADPSGRRRRSLRRVGRAVAVLFALWLAALALAGLGLLPDMGIPLASHAGAGSAPPPLDARSPLVAVKGARPALATPAATPRARPVPASAGPAPSQRRAVARRRGVARARKRTAVTAPPAPRGSTTAPGQTVAPPGRSGTAPGQIRAAKTPRPHPTPRAKPAPAPTATAAPSHGKSGSAPGLSSR